MTFNVYGLNEEFALDSLCLYLQDFCSLLDFLAIQEHKLRDHAISRLGHFL